MSARVVGAIVVSLLGTAGSAVVEAGQSPWWDVGPGELVENDFAAAVWYREGCLSIERLARARAGGATEFDPGVPPGGRCASSAGLRLDTVHWVRSFVGFRFGGYAGWRAFPGWGFGRVAVDPGVRLGPALGRFRPWADFAADVGYSDGSAWLDADGVGLSVVAGVGVDVGKRLGVRFGVRRRWPVVGAGPGHRYFDGHRHLAGGLLAWELGPLIRF